MRKEYVEEREGGFYIAGSRVSLDSIVYAFLRGESPDDIAESFPAINLEEVFGGLAFYLANRAQVDEYLRKGKAESQKLREESRRERPALYAKLESAKRANPISRP
jgi:uncharacterized protein (DUF433 family)